MDRCARLAAAVALAGAACAGGGGASMAGQGAARSAVEVVQAQLDAYNAADVEAFVACYAGDAELLDASGQVLARGRDALRERYGAIFRKYPRNHAALLERRTEGDGVVLDHELISGRAPDRPDPWDVGFVRYEVSGGLIRRVVLP